MPDRQRGIYMTRTDASTFRALKLPLSSADRVKSTTNKSPRKSTAAAPPAGPPIANINPPRQP
jgi:hypothetical protein